MSTTATGRILDEGGNPQHVHVVISDESALIPSVLGQSDTDLNGRFSISYANDFRAENLGYPARRLSLRVFATTLRLLIERYTDDNPSDPLNFGDIVVKNISGWAVTLDGSPSVFPVREGNAIRLLIDDQDAWSYLSDKLRAATTSIEMMQLEFDIPSQFNIDPTLEPPEIVSQFARLLDSNNRRVVHDPKDYRPERLLVDKSTGGVTVRVLIPTQPIKITFTNLLLLPFVAIAMFILSPIVRRGVWKFITGKSTISGTYSDALSYFTESTGKIDVENFVTTPYNRLHAKLALVDGNEAIVISSPFIQGYFDTPKHSIDDPKRGTGVDIPIHDVSVAVRGPAVADMHQSFRQHWQVAKPSDVPPTIPTAPPILTVPDPTTEYIAALQLVRTINGSVFPSPLEKGEKGILEAYLRAIGNANEFIYLENQYFTNDTIGDALIAALNDTASRPNLQVILLINVVPDIPFYPGWQISLIKRIREGVKPANKNRIGFFTLWTHENANPPDHPKPRIMPNYVHTKVGIVDGKWATFGSANLDGASLDYTQVLHALQPDDIRNHELNYVIFNGIEGPTTTNAIDVLRRRLWSEHLGLGENALAASGSGNDAWLTLWRDAAERKRKALTLNPTGVDPARILEYPLKPTSDPEDYLKGLSITFDNLELVDSVRPYSFHSGK